MTVKQNRQIIFRVMARAGRRIALDPGAALAHFRGLRTRGLTVCYPRHPADAMRT